MRSVATQDNERKSPDRYLKWAHAFVVVYSITSRASYDEARSYLDTIAQYQHITGKDIPVAVVGNKMDLERYRSVLSRALVTSAKEDMFSSLSLWLFATSRKNFRTDLHEIFSEGWQWTNEQMLNFGGDPDHRLHTGIVFRIRHYWEIRKVHG